MGSADPQAERCVREQVALGDSASAAGTLWKAYGAELYGWLVASHGHVDASDIASGVRLALVRAVGGFRGESSARTWLYQIARREVVAHHRARKRRRAVLTPLENHPSAEARPRSRGTAAQRELELEELRGSLDADERALLALRYDRELSYADIARIWFDAAESEDVERGAARLRQRVRALKARLVALRSGGLELDHR